LEISTKETIEIQQKNGRWYEKEAGPQQKEQRGENPKDQAICNWKK
jgi:hypothetical protein